MQTLTSPKVIFGLTALININEKRINYYSAASLRFKEVELTAWLRSYTTTLQQTNDILERWLTATGGSLPKQKNKSVLAKASWLRLKEFLTLSKRSTLLKHSMRMERDALKIYRTALALSFLPSATVKDIQKHLVHIEDATLVLMALSENNKERHLQVA